VTFPRVVDYLEGGSGKASRLVAADDQSAAIRFVRRFYLGWVVWKTNGMGSKSGGFSSERTSNPVSK